MYCGETLARVFSYGYCRIFESRLFCRTPGGCFWIICIAKVVFFEFRYFSFPYLIFDINIIYFLWYKQKSVNRFSLYKLMIFLAATMFETFENQLLTLTDNFPKGWNYNDKRNCCFICFLYFANGFLTLTILIVVYVITYLS